jgi:hypothetical protein
MKKLFALSLLVPSLAFGQALVSTTAQLRTGLLEDFTGIHCGYCPDGHAIMASIAAANPGQVSLVGVHAGVFAVPANGTEPDFRTPQGDSLNAFYNVNSYPSGVINRHGFTGGAAQGRGSWEGNMAQMLGMTSPVNLGVESSYDAGNQQLTVHVQLYYTADSPGGDDHISVLLTENHILGWQTDYGPEGNHGNYDHLHVLRTYITGIWGEAVNTTTTGTWVDRTYTCTVPSTWNVGNCEITAFVGEYQSDVYQSRTIAADGGTTLVTGVLTPEPAPYKGGANAQSSDFTVGMVNALGADGDYVVTLTQTDGPSSWGSALDVNGSAFTSGSTVAVADDGNAQVVVHITPDAAPGIGNYLLTISSVQHPTAPVLQQELHVISGVHDLIVTNPQAEQWNGLYIGAMEEAWESAYAQTSRDEFTKFGQAGALSGVLNLYLNVSWTFPSLLDDEVEILTSFMDNGGNLMIAGQDIGWDQSGATGSYGTPATQAFYTGRMLANFVADGSSASTSVNFTDADPVFGTLPNGNIANVFGGNTYPDQITPTAPANGILTYNATANIGGLRAQTANYKLVYFAVGPEQMAYAPLGRAMVTLSHNWFYGTLGIHEFDAAIGSLGQAYPVPADGSLTIPVNSLKTDVTLEVFDAMGRKVITQATSRTSSQVVLNTQDLSDGVYSYRIRTADSAGKARSFVISH